MKKQDNFEDNLYLLLIRINLIRDTLTLNMDPEIFFSKVLEDIDFIDKILKILLRKLQENLQRIDREGLLDHLSEIEWQYCKVLSEILDGSGSISAHETPSLQTRISNLLKDSTERRKTEEALANSINAYQREPVISRDEFNELLKDF